MNTPFSTDPAQCGPETSLWLRSLSRPGAGTMLEVRQLLYSEASPFQKIEIYDTTADGKVLLLGGTVVLTEADEFMYHEMIVHPGLCRHPSPHRVCIIGGGDGGSLREVLKHPEVQQVVVVDIDEQVRQAVGRFFPGLAKGFDDPRCTFVCRDGYAFLQAAQEKFDVIIIDSYDPGGPVQTLVSADFYEQLATALALGGITVLQTESPLHNPAALQHALTSVSLRLRECRPYFCLVPTFPGSVCSFLMAGSEFCEDADPDRLAALEPQCRYFNRDIGQGAFLLPAFMQRDIQM